MKRRLRPAVLAVLAVGFIHCYGENKVLQYFSGNTYSPVDWTEIREISVEGSNDIIGIYLNSGETLRLPVSDKQNIPSGATVPLISIVTDENLTEIPNKVDYKKGIIRLKGFGDCDDVETTVNIRGRGNSSWTFPKKPYRLKFDKKISLCGLPAAKNYVLLANYTDPSLMQFAVALKLGEILELPFNPTVVPVDVTLNGIYKGSYLLANKPGINAGSVDIDETKSIMWELDVAYDEDYKFISPVYNLPVMVSDPDMDEDTFLKWREDFIAMEKGVAEDMAADYVDLETFAKYLLVYEIMDNNETGYPKSVKLYKTGNGKYQFGPIWDFDVSMGYDWENRISYKTDHIKEPIWQNKLSYRLMQCPEVKRLLRENWEKIRSDSEEIMEYIDDYASRVKTSAIRNEAVWPEYDDFSSSIRQMKTWLQMRFEAMPEILDSE